MVKAGAWTENDMLFLRSYLPMPLASGLRLTVQAE